MSALYATEAAAFARANAIRRTTGAWPGVRRVMGGWDLTYDPDIRVARAASTNAGRFSELGAKPGGERRWPQARGRSPGVERPRSAQIDWVLL